MFFIFKKLITSLSIIILMIQPKPEEIVYTYQPWFDLYNINNDKEDEEFNKEREYSMSVYDCARTFVGMKGDCYQIVKKFIVAFHNKTINQFDLVSVPYEESLPGDILFYENNGWNNKQHWAVYLGVDLALHGNFSGETKIASIVISKGIKPTTYFRLVEKSLYK